ncbi:hypothetical protein NUM_72130 [Actinocatenispora comari]|uniref:Tat pathway signal sequence n=1 Tax=Actinocatenispora comari TaxID=2807577 RepID=A0A8J4ESH9_9ACTN|nr:hypothetical protein NUM_72130 [Actinocatenispora comari]
MLLAAGGGVAWWRHGSGTEPKRAGGHAGGAAPAPGRTSRSPSPKPSKQCDADCVRQQRYAAARKYMDQHAATNAYLSVQITDRTTGKSWQHGPVTHPGWTASTIKLAMATDILRRQRAGEVTLSDADRTDLANMLNFSDENASDRLWQRYGGDAQLARFRDVFGMSGLHFVPGFTDGTYWGFVKCTTEDLSHLMTYVLTKTAPDDRAYLVSAMRGVASNQQWGVWAAGHDQQPGDKNGWSFETDSYGKHWVLNSVGFAGPDERYAVAIMFQVQPHSTIAYGTHTVSDVVGLLFGVPAPARITVPEPDG